MEAELYVYKSQPQFDPATQRLELTESFDAESRTRTYDWQIVALTEAEKGAYQAKVRGPQAEAIASKLVLREQIAAKIDALPDEDKATLAYLYDEWAVGQAYAIGDIVRVGDAPYRVLQAHTSQADWTPATAASLFTPLRAGSGGHGQGQQPDEWVAPTGGHNAYQTGDRVTFNGSVYESLIDANVWSPTAYPAGWQLVE